MKRLMFIAICVIGLFLCSTLTSCNEDDTVQVVRGEWTYDVVVLSCCEMPEVETRLVNEALLENDIDLVTMSVTTDNLTRIHSNITHRLRNQIATPTVIGFTLRGHELQGRYAAKINLPIED